MNKLTTSRADRKSSILVAGVFPEISSVSLQRPAVGQYGVFGKDEDSVADHALVGFFRGVDAGRVFDADVFCRCGSFCR